MPVTVSIFGLGLQIRVSVVRFRPWHHFQFFETQRVSGITGGLSSGRAGPASKVVRNLGEQLASWGLRPKMSRGRDAVKAKSREQD